MANDQEEAAAIYPKLGFPTMFVDGVLNAVYSEANTKMYFFRFEPSFNASSAAQMTPVMQMVMPTESFVQMACFIDLQVKLMLEKGLISQERLDQIRNSTVGVNPSGQAILT